MKKRLGRVDLFIFALILMATLLRLVLIYLHWPVTNSDEGNMGLLARHIAYNGEWPIFFYGFPYMGPIEGYIAAPLFRIFGPSTFTLRLGLLPFFPLFLICMYYLTRLLFTQRMAVFIVVLFCFGSDEVISRQIKAVGEYPELLFFAAFVSLVVAWLVLSSTTDQYKRTTPGRVFIYGVLGIATGIALWVDFLILPFLGTAFVLLLLFCRRELLSWAGLSIIVGALIGAFPLLYYNLTAPKNQNSLAELLRIHHSGSTAHLPFMQQIIGTIMISIPDATGFNPRCMVSNFPYFGTLNKHCVVLQGGWGAGYLLLLAIATLLVALIIRRGWNGRSLLHPEWTFEERQQMMRQCCQLMLLVSAIGTILLYASSAVSAIAPEPTARYLECVLVALPATIWPLWNGLSNWRHAENWWSTISVIAHGFLLLLLLLMFIWGTFGIVLEIPDAQTAYQQQDLMVQKLFSLGATRIYSEYWTCNRLTFQSEEKIICSALNERLKPGFDRYGKYRSIVGADPHPAYVFPKGMKQVAALNARMEHDKGFSRIYQRLTFEGDVIYVPKRQS